MTLTAGHLDLLLQYHWPGNVRELAAVIERAAILGDGRELDVPAALGTTLVRNQPQPESALESSASTHFATLDQLVRQHIEQALMRTRGRVEGEGGAARLLGVNPHTLRSRMRKLGIRWGRFRTQTPPWPSWAREE